MGPVEQLEQILPAVVGVAAAITPEQLTNATPCARFAVADIFDHMITLGTTFSFLFRGEEVPSVAAPVRTGEVPIAGFRTAMDGLFDAIRSPGALERMLVTPVGTMPGEAFARLVAFDGLVHGWDLARATNQPFPVSDEVVAAVDEFARAALAPEMRDGDTFKAETTPPPGAGRLDRLAAFSGRTV